MNPWTPITVPLIIAAGSCVPFVMLAQEYGWKRAVIALGIGNILGALAGLLLISWNLLSVGYRIGEVYEELNGPRGLAWIAISAMLGMFLSFISVMYFGHRLGWKSRRRKPDSASSAEHSSPD